jgi:hypothetical protein
VLPASEMGTTVPAVIIAPRARAPTWTWRRRHSATWGSTRKTLVATRSAEASSSAVAGPPRMAFSLASVLQQSRISSSGCILVLNSSSETSIGRTVRSELVECP